MTQQQAVVTTAASGKPVGIQSTLGGSVVVVCETGKGLTQNLSDGRHHLLGDEPLSSGGNDAGPDPYELLLMALGTCTSVTLRLYARMKQWPLDHISVQLRHTRNHLSDC